MKKTTDEKLIKLCLRGKPSAQRMLYDKYSSMVYTVCFRYAKNSDDAQDLLQETFINVFKNLNSFQHSGSFDGWIRRIAVNCAIQLYHKNEKRLDTKDIHYEIDPITYSSVIDELSAQEIMDTINALPDGYRIVFNLYAIEGYSHKEIGERLNITESASRSQLTRARKLLMEMVGKPVNQGL